jgi:signal transduction histidine kinase
MTRSVKIIKQIILLFLISLFPVNLIAQEEIINPYFFKLDTTITGRIIGEGKIFPDSKISLISFLPWFSSPDQKPKINFLNSEHSIVYQINFNLKNISINYSPLVFDFDGDSFDEILFAVFEKKKTLSFLYFDPSNNPVIKTNILKIPIVSGLNVRLSLAQLDKDNTPEVMAYIYASSNFKFALNKLLAFDVITKKVLWEKLNAEKISYQNPISIVNKKNSYLVYSTSGSSSVARLIFSNNKFFYIFPKKRPLIYDDYFNTYNNIKIDTSADDYSIDTLALIKAIDLSGKTIWERKLGGVSIKTQIDTIRINGKKKILLLVFTETTYSKIKSRIEIINPENGKTEKSLLLSKRIKRSIVTNNNIYISFNDYSFVHYDSLLTPKDSTRTEYIIYSPLALTKNNFLFVKRGPLYYQEIFAFDKKLNLLAKIQSRGIAVYFPKSDLLSIYFSGDRKSKIYSILPVKWYKKISKSTIRNVVIALLLILIVITILWTNTLRVSWKKIKAQKEALEKAHVQLKQTTQKLIETEKLAVYGTLISSIAHEINSPLGAIINSAQRIKKYPNADIDENVDLIERAGKRSKAIIEKLLLGTRNKHPEEKANFKEVLEDWMMLTGKQFLNLGIEFEKQIDCNKELAISSTELNQIFTNVFMNARDSIVEKKGKEKKISIKINSTENNNCKIVIRDTGTGFNEERLKNPFEAFNTSKEQGKGTGLGLWVIKNILDKIGGKISIRNYEKGAEIELIIPIYLSSPNEKG